MKKIFARSFYFLSAIAIVASISAVAFKVTHVPVAHAQTTITASALVGYAWSDNIGWISFNGSNYGVNEDSSGNLTGYAWSDSIGWIKFGGLNAFPSGSGSTNSNAYIDSSGTMHGWVRACAGTAAGDCSSMTSRTDGWDGWISLDGSNYSVGYNSTDKAYEGWAWGSDVVGWVNFITGTATTQCSSGGNCTTCTGVCTVNNNAPALSCSGTLNPSTNQITWTATVASGTPQYVFTWTPGTGASGSANTNANTGVSTYTTGTLASSSPATSYSVSVTATSNGSTVTGASCPSVSGPLSNNTQTGSMCTSIPANATLCSGSATGAGASSLVSSCSATGGSPLCQYQCSAGYHQVGNQCIGNGSLQEQ